jgi:DNA-binding MarR family transcriptional regulator
MDNIDRIRAFNCLWTGRIGLLSHSYLGSGLGLTDVRVLHDLAEGPVRARTLAQTLGLDEGYLSRILRRFEARGWLTRNVIAGDARTRTIALTEEGRDAARSFRATSREAIAELLAGLGRPQQTLLEEGLTLAAAAFDPTPAALRALKPGDAGWIIARHAELYMAD